MDALDRILEGSFYIVHSWRVRKTFLAFSANERAAGVTCTAPNAHLSANATPTTPICEFQTSEEHLPFIATPGFSNLSCVACVFSFWSIKHFWVKCLSVRLQFYMFFGRLMLDGGDGCTTVKIVVNWAHHWFCPETTYRAGLILRQSVLQTSVWLFGKESAIPSYIIPNY